MGYRPARLWAWLAGIAEFGGGLLFALGLFWPLGTVGIASAMITAIVRAHWPRIWAADRGLELPLTYLVVALAAAVSGPGAYSLDAVLDEAAGEPDGGDCGGGAGRLDCRPDDFRDSACATAKRHITAAGGEW